MRANICAKSWRWVSIAIESWAGTISSGWVVPLLSRSRKASRLFRRNPPCCWRLWLWLSHSGRIIVWSSWSSERIIVVGLAAWVVSCFGFEWPESRSFSSITVGSVVEVLRWLDASKISEKDGIGRVIFGGVRKKTSSPCTATEVGIVETESKSGSNDWTCSRWFASS